MDGTINSVKYLLNQTKLFGKTLDDAMAEANIVSYSKKVTRPILISTLQYDSLVSPLNAENFVKDANSNVTSVIFNNNNFRKCLSLADNAYNAYGGNPVDHVGG